jgi:hypothetical protein
VGQKFGADDPAEAQEQHHDERRDAHPQREFQMVEAALEQATIVFLQPVKNRVAPFLDFIFEKQSAKHGRNQEGKNQGSQKGERHRPSHGTEEAALHPLKSEDRQVGNDNNDAGRRAFAPHAPPFQSFR